MKNLIRFFCLIFFVIQNSVAKADPFPTLCEGTWKGTMHIWSSGRLMDSVKIKLTILPLMDERGTYSWKTEYFSETHPMVKDYIIYQKEGSIHEYIIDEGEGVLLTNYVYGSKMYNLFKVGKTWLTSSYEFLEDQLIFEVTSGAKSKLKSKGGVANYTFDFLQRAVLKRTEE